MELRQLRYFEAVASTLNFSRAAERLHIAQPPLSRQIQQLEDELGVQLLDRTTRPITLTNAGLFFYDQTVQVLARIKEMQNATRRLAAEGTRWMGIGFVPSILYGFLPKVLREFSVNNENINITLTELTSVQQLRRDDIAYRPLSNKGITSRLLMTIRAGDATEHVARFCTTIRQAVATEPAVPARPRKKTVSE